MLALIGPAMTWLLLAVVGLAVTSIGFRRFVHFISVGYAFSVAAMMVALVIARAGHVALGTWAQIAMLGMWGVRLGSYIVSRERQESYQRVAGEVPGSLGRKLVIWPTVTLLYLAMVSPAVFAATSASTPGLAGAAVQWIGVAVGTSGLVVESMADRQKSAIKRADPDAFASTGLFGWVRTPNYLGEILMWLGNLVAGAPYLNTWWMWLIAALGTGSLAIIMLGAAKRLERKHESRYGSRPDYQAYARTVPLLFPWIGGTSFKNLNIPEM